MNTVRVFIITEGDKKIGFGHITRCISLYQAFEEKGVAVEFILNGDGTVKDLLKDKKKQIFNWLKEKRVFKIIRGAAIAVVDSYLADVKFYEKISETIKVPVFIDDNKRIDYPKGIVVNGGIYAEDLGYPKNKEMTYLLGNDYILLRKEFWSVPEKKIRDRIESMLITFGGTDIQGLTSKILKLIARIYPALKKNIIIGKGFNPKDIEEIKRSKDTNTDLVYYPDSKEVQLVMLKSDIAISSGGQTLYELARIGTPTIAIATADNQVNSAKALEREGFIKYGGWRKDPFISDNILKCLAFLKSRKERRARSDIGKRIVNGEGSRNVVNILLRKHANG